MVTLFKLIAGELTVAVICSYCAAVVKPVGVPMLIFDVPAVAGWKVVDWLFCPDENTSGLVVIVPTAVFELVTGTLTEETPGLMFRKN